MGFLASRQGVAERRLIDIALDLCRQFDHRGAPGHGAGLLLDIPWPLLLDRFPEHVRLIAQHDVALGMFFLPFEAVPRRRCVKRVEELAALAEADVLGWADVPVDLDALPAGAAARRTAPVVRQALFRRPAGLSEDGWLACRYLLRLALDEVLSEEVGNDFSIASLSNRTVVYKGLAELSKIGQLYPDLRDPHYASRFVLFHSRYSTNTTTAWRRAQPFWALGHNGEISTIKGNVAWMEAIGPDLVSLLVERHPRLARIGARVRSIICAGGSDTANLDDMVIALLTGGLSLPQAILALLPEAPSLAAASDRLTAFHEAMSVFLGACDGPAAIVACDGDEAVAHLDRNGLRPLWLLTTQDYALAASELTGTVDLGPVETQKLFGPGDTVVVNLKSGDVLLTDEVHRLVSGQRFPAPHERVTLEAAAEAEPPPVADLRRLQIAFGMTREDEQVLLAALCATGKPAVGSMGDDTPPAAMLDRLPRRLEDHFKLRFAQETSPPIDPIRDAWVFETAVALGDRSGLWRANGKDGKQAAASGPVYMLPERILSMAELAALEARPGIERIGLLFDVTRGAQGLEAALDDVVARGLNLAGRAVVIVLSDRGASGSHAAVPLLRAASRLHDALVKVGLRHRVGIVADAAVWDIQHAALLVSVGADALCPWLGCLSAGEREKTYLKGLRGGFVEAMSMMGVTPASAYCGAKLIEAVGLDPAWLRTEFPGVARHLGGIGPADLDREWLSFHAEAFQPGARAELVDAGEFRYRNAARPHGNNPDVVRTLHAASGYAARGKDASGSKQAYETFAHTVNDRAAARRPRPAAHRAARRDRPARGGRERGARAVALHGARHERGRALRARAPRGRARDERAPPLLPREVPAQRRRGPARHRPDRELRRGRLRQEPHRPRRRQPQHPVRGRALHGHAHDGRPRGRGRGEVRPGRQAGQGRPAAGQEGLPAHRAAARLRAGLRARLAAREPQPLLDRGRQADGRELAPPQPGRARRAQVRGDPRRRDGVHGRRQRRRQPAAPLGRLRRHRRRQARRPEARRRAGGGGAAGGAGHAGRGRACARTSSSASTAAS